MMLFNAYKQNDALAILDQNPTSIAKCRYRTANQITIGLYRQCDVTLMVPQIDIINGQQQLIAGNQIATIISEWATSYSWTMYIVITI